MNSRTETTTARRPRRMLRIDWLFVAAVLAPTLLAGLYYGLLASDVYVSESRFVIRSPEKSTPTGLGALLQGTGLSRAKDDTYSVHDFVRSRDALRELDQKLGLRAKYSDAAIDRIARFPTWPWDDSFEAFHRHYQNHVAIDYDAVSSISVLTVRAFSAEDAWTVNDELLKMGERLINQLNERIRRDLVEFAQTEVDAAEERAKATSVALLAFRTKQSVFAPEQQAALQLQGVAKLQEELIAAEAQLLQLRQLSPNNPQIGSLNTRVQSLRRSIAAESAKVAGGGGGTISAKSAGFDRLVLDREFADRQLAAAMVSLETARNEARRQQLYLERLVQPHVPDDAVEPRRIRAVLTVLVLGLIVWGVGGLVVASVREHTE